MNLPPVLLRENPTLNQQPHHATLFCLILCVAHNFMANAFLPRSVQKCPQWKFKGMLRRTQAFVNNFLALLCVQYATEWCVLIDGANSIQSLHGHPLEMAMRMAREFEKRFPNLLPDEKFSYSIDANVLRDCNLRQFINNMKGTVKDKFVSSVNYCHASNPSTKAWTKAWGSALPFAWCYFLRQTLTKFELRCNEYENNFFITEEEKQMLRNQPVYCRGGMVPEDDDE